MENKEKENHAETFDGEEFHLEMLRFQTERSSSSSSALTMLAIEVSTFVLIAVAYLFAGLTENNPWYILIAVCAIVALIVSIRLTHRYFERQKSEKMVKRI